MMGGAILGCPAQRAESALLSKKRTSRYSPRARAGLWVHGHSFPRPDGAGLLRASRLGVEQGRVGTALRRKWEPEVSAQDTMEKLPTRIDSPLGLAGLPPL